jgi:hypothetical protein
LIDLDEIMKDDRRGTTSNFASMLQQSISTSISSRSPPQCGFASTLLGNLLTEDQ